MIKIILASQSPARKQLLTAAGFKVVQSPVKVKEEVSLKNGVRGLVIANARKKAAVAVKKFKKGIIIGADTVVFAKGRLIGKPKNIKDAEKTIKFLSRNPHWVYSGLAVYDIEAGLMRTASEKTKIYMGRLSDRQIKAYCRKFSPLNKAGSFDIQGPGALFIERINGCYYNVVGLPLAKLVKILSQFGIDIFGIDGKK